MVITKEAADEILSKSGTNSIANVMYDNGVREIPVHKAQVYRPCVDLLSPNLSPAEFTFLGAIVRYGVAKQIAEKRIHMGYDMRVALYNDSKYVFVLTCRTPEEVEIAPEIMEGALAEYNNTDFEKLMKN